MNCTDCPRSCRADRDNGEIGMCGGGKLARIAKTVDPFDYEEPCLGSVTAVFFGGCALGCTYCQNYKISRGSVGIEYTDAELAALFDGADRDAIDLVTPSHYLGAIERALSLAKQRRRYIYNTSGYETLDAVKRASAFTDVFLTDYKYADAQTGREFSRAADYCTIAADALRAMRDTVDEWEEKDGVRILKRGLIVRHLVLPGHVKNSIEALDTIARTVGVDTVLSLMSQFTPNGVGAPYARLSKLEYKIVAEHALKLGFKNGYFQEFSSADSSYTPKF